MNRRARLTLVALCFTLLLSACDSGPLAPYAWLGQGQSDLGGDPYSVRLVFTLYGDKFYGNYYLLGATDPTGDADGTIDGRDLSMVLTTVVPEGSDAQPCVFDLIGSIDDEKLTGIIEPRNPACLPPKGSWDLDRQP